jgi:hypothetical protein
MKYIVPVMALLSLSLVACTGSSDTTATTGALESCFATSTGHMKCVATPDGVNRSRCDVDGDGRPDTFVCANNGGDPREDCARLGCRDVRDHHACDGGRATGDHDGGFSGGDRDRTGGGGATTGAGGGEGEGGDDMICPPSMGGGGAGGGAAGAPGTAGTGAGGTIG